MRYTTRCVVGALALLMATSAVVANGLDAPDPRKLQRVGQRLDLSWAATPTTYLSYALAEQASVPAPEGQAAGAKELEAALSYVHFYPYELAGNGAYHRTAMPLTNEELMFQLGAATPEGKNRAGFAWTREWKFEHLVSFPTLLVNSAYEQKDVENFGGAECVVLTGKHSRREPAKPDAEGSLRWLSFEAETTAWFNLDEGRMQAVETTFRGVVFRPKTAAAAQTTDAHNWKARWQFSREFDSTADRYLNERVSVAIERGVERLWKLRNADGNWPYGANKRGGTALALLTLLMCDADKNDERIAQAFEQLKGMEMENTYSVACSLMAYEARYISEEEKRAYLSNPDKPPEFKRNVSAEDREQMEILIAWLAANQNEGNPFYNYHRGGEGGAERFDFSNTQYALLGLAAAQRCDIKIPAGIIKRLVEGTMDYQQKMGPKFKRVIGYKPPTDKRKEGKSTYASKPVEARGWNYSTKATWDKYSEEGNAYGSMTTAGLTCLLVGLDVANSMDAEAFKAEFGNKAAHQAWEKAVHESLECGMAWMEYWFSVTRNPNKGKTWYLYYLYGMERVMMLAGVRYLGVFNWYNQGAACLVTTQAEDGGWGSMPDTCFALLFLKKGTVPSRRKVTTGDK